MKIALRTPWSLFVATRVLLIALTYIAYTLFTAPVNYSSTPGDLPALLTSWSGGDVGTILHIAQYGYQEASDFSIFPLFPLLIALPARLFGEHSYLLVGTVWNNLFFLGSLFLLEKCIQKQWGKELSDRVLLYLCISPFAFFFFTSTGDALSLFLIVSVFFALQNCRWGLAGLCSMLATLAVPYGILLSLPYLMTWWQYHHHHQTTWRQQCFHLLPLALIILAPGLLSLYCHFVFHNSLLFLQPDHWSRTLTLPGTSLWHALSNLFMSITTPTTLLPIHHIEYICTHAVLLFLLFFSRHLVPRPWFIWMISMWLFLLLFPSIDSTQLAWPDQRVCLLLFPIILVLAIASKRSMVYHEFIVIGSITLQVILSVTFFLPAGL